MWLMRRQHGRGRSSPIFWMAVENGLLVPPDDEEAMANAVMRVLGEPKLAESLSRNGRRKAEGHDWSIVIPRWEQVFQKVAKDG